MSISPSIAARRMTGLRGQARLETAVIGLIRILLLWQFSAPSSSCSVVLRLYRGQIPCKMASNGVTRTTTTRAHGSRACQRSGPAERIKLTGPEYDSAHQRA